MKTFFLGFIAWIVLLANSALAQNSCFFRLLSTQPTEILSVDEKGLLSWSNAVPGAGCTVQAKRTLDGAWTNNFPMSPVRTNGAWSCVRVPTTNVLTRFIVALQPTATLPEAEALFEAEELIWGPLAWNSLRMALIHVPEGRSLTNLAANPLVRYIEHDGIYVAF